MTIQRIPMTVKGELMLRNELQDLKRSQRPKIISDIAEAREHGDLKENAEYHAARECQSFIEGRIKEIESKLVNSYVIDVTKLSSSGRVVFGSTVTLLRTKTGEKATYQIVGEEEANIKQNKISVTSPLSRSIIGKKSADIFSVDTPSGSIEYKITLVEYL
jgi:transcription elongation factor GreA